MSFKRRVLAALGKEGLLEIGRGLWCTYPWPQEPPEEQGAAAARGLRFVRLDLMSENGWSLRSLQAAELEGPPPRKDAQAALANCIEPLPVGL